LSYWRDEDAVRQWRNNDEHRQVQSAGRDFIFAAYRLCVAQVLRAYDMHDRAQAPEDSRAAHSQASDCSADDPQATPGSDTTEGEGL
jgi:hypothetical protein